MNPVRSRLLVTAFRSLGTTALSHGHHSKVNVPGLPLRRPAEPSSSPLTFCSTTCPGFDPATGRFNAQTRCLTSAQHSRLLLESPLPVGAVPPLRIKAFNPIRFRANSPSESARSAFTPRNLVLVRSTIADQRSSLATFPSACCSSNLLEPLTSCASVRNPSNNFCGKRSYFLRRMRVHFHTHAERARWKSCG